MKNKIMKKLRKWKGVMSFLMALLILFCSISINWTDTGDNVYADGATDRVTTFINLAKSNSIEGEIEGINNLTQDELRFLGIYLSNFYVPFATELGLSEDDKRNEKILESMSNALKTNLNFSEDICTLLVNEVMGLSRSNYKELDIRISKEYQKDYEKWLGEDGKPVCIVNGLLLFQAMTGMLSVSADYDSKGYQYGYFGYEEDGTFYPVLDFCFGSNTTPTVSMVAYQQCLGSVDLKQYGVSLFDFLKDEDVESASDIRAYLADKDNSVAYQMSIYGSKIAVDCFGNIMQLGSNHQYVVLPGCMNPYSWYKVNASGEDITLGRFYPIVTFAGISMANSGNKYISNVSDNAGAGSTAANILANAVNVAMGSNLGNQELCFGTLKATAVNSSFKTALSGKGLKKGESIKSKDKKYNYALRLYRGSNVALNEGNTFGKENKEILQMVEDGCAEANKDVLTQSPPTLGGYTLNNGVIGVKDKGNLILPINMFNDLPNVPLLNNLVIIDNLGAYNFDSNESNESYSDAINIVGYYAKDGSVPKKLSIIEKNDSFTNKFKNMEEGIMSNVTEADTATILGIYTTYAIAGLYENDAESKKATIGKLGYRFNIEGLPKIENKAITIPDSMKEDMQLKAIQNWIYYILHPQEGLEYVRLLVKNKTNAILIGWHNDMLGTNGVGNTTGTTAYRSNVGYVSIPDLSEIQWTSSLINLYNRSIPFLIVIMLIIMLFAYVAGIMPLQRAVFGLVIFSMFLLAPVTVINNVVGVGNRVSQKIYGEKFTYWAVVQEESYNTALEEAASKPEYESYLRELYALNSAEYSNQGGDSIVLKWQAPKKMSSLMLSKGDSDTLSSLKNSRLIKGVLNRNAMSGQSYLESDSIYMYRSYTDLANFSRFIYNGIKENKQPSYNEINIDDKSSLKPVVDSISTEYEDYITKGYTNSNKNGDIDAYNTLRLIKPLSSDIYKNAVGKTNMEELTETDFVGINQDAFNFSVSMFNQTDKGYTDVIEANVSDGNREDLTALFSNYSDEDKEKELSGLAAYGLMSESPFYYYSWCLYDQGMDTGSNASGNYKTLLLGQDNGGYFYNNVGNGELKDFMDMHSLFTYIIPYLKQGNDVVREWDKVHGIKVYDGVPTEEGHWQDPDIVNNKELKQKYWHNLNVARLYEIYTPWVDLMYDCSYAKEEKITVMGKKYLITDPINPASYPEERPMIFSESEMYDYGLTEADLTEVERRILKCNRGMEERMYELLNYYSFSDVTLNTAAAMGCTFEFNTVFSENGILKENINLYPQSFEISDFSFDAFLRMILANTLGEDIIIDPTDENPTDFYTTVVNKSSSTTAFMYIIVDIASQIALPAFKIFFIMAVFVSSILLIIATAFKVDPEQKFINKLLKGICVPMGGLLFINIGFSWVISLFMGVGNNAVTQSNVLSVQTGDPAITMLIIIALDGICIALYLKLIVGMLKDIKHNFNLSKAFIGGAIGGAISAVGSFAYKVSSSSKGGANGSVGKANYAEEGTGRQSTRAAKRASEKSAEGRSEEGSTRINDSKRETFKQSTNKGKSSKEQKDKINSKIKSGNEKIQENTERAKDTVERANSNVVKEGRDTVTNGKDK